MCRQGILELLSVSIITKGDLGNFRNLEIQNSGERSLHLPHSEVFHFVHAYRMRHNLESMQIPEVYGYSTA